MLDRRLQYFLYIRAMSTRDHIPLKKQKLCGNASHDVNTDISALAAIAAEVERGLNAR